MPMDKGTITRFVFFVLSWANAAAANAGLYHLPNISEEGVAVVVAFVISAWTYWKNNNHTKPAVEGQIRINQLKKRR